MTNKQAIQIVLENKDPSNAERLAAMYACDDILEMDIDVWLSKDVSEYLPQFPDIAESLVEDLLKEDGISVERVANSLTEVSRSMYYYVKFYEILSSYDMALSERWQGERRMVCREILQRASCLAISTIESIEKQSLSFPCINHN